MYFFSKLSPTYLQRVPREKKWLRHSESRSDLVKSIVIQKCCCALAHVELVGNAEDLLRTKITNRIGAKM